MSDSTWADPTDTMMGVSDTLGLTLTRFIQQYSWVLALIAFFTVSCVVTRIKTGSQVNFGAVQDGTTTSHPRAVPVQPYWVPWLGHTVPFGISYQSYLQRISKRTKSQIYALIVAGNKFNIITSPSLTKQVLDKPGLPTEMESLVYFILKNFFGDKGGEIQKAAETDHDAVWVDLHKPLYLMQRDPWLGSAAARTARAVGDQVYNLMSGMESWVDQSSWERVSRTEVVSTDGKGYFVAETDLFQLLREWVGTISTELLFGRAFLENNPNALTDLWHMDSKIMQFMMGLPSIMVPGLLPAAAARERLITAIWEHHEAMHKIKAGQDPGSKYDGLNDVPQVISHRVESMDRIGLSPRTSGSANLTVLWAMNVNANPVIFWMVFYIYATPGLLAKLRQEIAPYVTVRRPESVGMSIQEAPKLDIDTPSLCNKCPLLKATYFETMRLEVGATAYRKATEDFTLTESEEDAKIAGKSRPETYIIRKGESVFIPSKIHQDDAEYWFLPEDFDPTRFFVTSSSKSDGGHHHQEEDEANQAEVEAETVTVSQKSLRPFGGGKTMCKGRFFAEREVLIFVSAVITMWEMSLVDKDMVEEGKSSSSSKNGKTTGKWKHPGRVETSATTRPKVSPRVRVYRRREILK